MKASRTVYIFLALILSFVVNGCASNADKAQEKAKYIFLFIGDGMGTTHVATAESYLSYKANGEFGGTHLTMTGFPYYGISTTYSANHRVTDSAASGTAIACGEKANNASVGVDADGNPIRSIAYDLKDDGYSIGILTTVPVNHATPSAFYANNRSRNAYYDISKQIVTSGFDFFAGSGFIDFRGKSKEERPIDEYIEENGYNVCYGIEEYNAEAKEGEKIVFCQASNKESSAGNYVSEGKLQEDATLGQMLEIAMKHIDTEDPFFFMCEGGKIDWTAHDHRTMPMIMDIIEFDNAISIAYEFYKEHPDETLIVVTADHETGGISLGAGPDVNWEPLLEQWEKDNHKNNLSDEDNAALNSKASIGWTTGSHTGAPVPVYAIGKGAEKFCGRMDNTEFKGKILGE